MRRALISFGLIILVLASFVTARAETRLALLIANKAYGANVGALANPHKDAVVVGAALRELGFEVEILHDATRGQTLAAVDDYGRRLGEAGPGAVGFFYYSGHGAAKPGSNRNYIVPVDVLDARKSSFWFDAVPLEEVRALLHENAPEAANVVVFDACRSELLLPVRGAKGFAPVQSWGGMLIAYSTAPNTTATDGDPDAPAGPYALALAEELGQAAGTSASDLFGRVRINVRRRQPAQSPWFQSGLDRQVAFGRPFRPVVGGTGPTSEEMEEFNLAAKSDTTDLMEAFLERRRTTPLRPAAEIWIRRRRTDAERLESEQARRRQAGEAWAEVRDTRSIAELEAFLEAHGESAYAEAAALAIGSLRDNYREAQALLRAMGYLEGSTFDGWGDESRQAMRRFQEEVGVDPADGFPDLASLGALHAERARRAAADREQNEHEQQGRREAERRVERDDRAAALWAAVATTREMVDLDRFLEEFGDTSFAGKALAAKNELFAEFREAQAKLKRLGLYSIPVDGDWGPTSRKALKTFQLNAGLKPADGVLTAASLETLRNTPDPPTEAEPASNPAVPHQPDEESEEEDAAAGASLSLSSVQGEWGATCSGDLSDFAATIDGGVISVRVTASWRGVMIFRGEGSIDKSLSVDGTLRCRAGCLPYSVHIWMSGTAPNIRVKSSSQPNNVCRLSRR